jgi:hypothetical protein
VLEEVDQGEEVHEVPCIDGATNPIHHVRARRAPSHQALVLDIVNEETGGVEGLDQPASQQGLPVNLPTRGTASQYLGNDGCEHQPDVLSPSAEYIRERFQQLFVLVAVN